MIWRRNSIADNTRVEQSGDIRKRKKFQLVFKKKVYDKEVLENRDNSEFH